MIYFVTGNICSGKSTAAKIIQEVADISKIHVNILDADIWFKEKCTIDHTIYFGNIEAKDFVFVHPLWKEYMNAVCAELIEYIGEYSPDFVLIHNLEYLSRPLNDLGVEYKSLYINRPDAFINAELRNIHDDIILHRIIEAQNSFNQESYSDCVIYNTSMEELFRLEVIKWCVSRLQEVLIRRMLVTDSSSTRA